MDTGGNRQRDALVIGGGISGLTTGWHLARAGLDVELLEAGPRVGGSIVTPSEGGWLFELGPNTVLENNPHVGPLVEAAGLADDKLVATSVGKRRYLWKRGRLQPLPAGPASFLRTRLFSGSAKARILREPFVRPRQDEREESVAEFVRRRLGGEMLDYAVGPFVSGVYAGDPERLSVQWATAKIHALEKQHGSLVKGALAKRKGPAPSGHMITIRQGLDALPARLAAGIPTVRTQHRLPARAPWRRRALPRHDGRRHAHGAPRRPRRPGRRARAAARRGDGRRRAALRRDALRPHRPHRARLPARGRRAPARRLRLPRAALRVAAHPRLPLPVLALPGSRPGGPRRADRVRGRPHRPGGRGVRRRRASSALVTAELRRALGTRAAPVVVHVRRWPRAIPQYEVGHGRFVTRARELEARLPGLSIGGNVLGGVSVPGLHPKRHHAGRRPSWQRLG